MSIDPNTLPEGAFVHCLGGQTIHALDRLCTEVTAVYVPVPEGMTYSDAEAALADAGAWVGVIDPAHCPNGARMMNRWTNGLGGDNLYVHRDDLPPTDPDAELVAAIEKSVPIGSWDGREVLRRLRAEGFDVTHEAAR